MTCSSGSSWNTLDLGVGVELGRTGLPDSSGSTPYSLDGGFFEGARAWPKDAKGNGLTLFSSPSVPNGGILSFQADMNPYYRVDLPTLPPRKFHDCRKNMFSHLLYWSGTLVFYDALFVFDTQQAHQKDKSGLRQLHSVAGHLPDGGIAKVQQAQVHKLLNIWVFKNLETTCPGQHTSGFPLSLVTLRIEDQD